MVITCILQNSTPHHQPQISDSPCHNRRHLPQTLTKTPILAISFSSPTDQQSSETTEAEWRCLGEGDGERGWVRKTETREAVGWSNREEEGGRRESKKGRRHNNRRGKLPRPRESWKTLTIDEHSGSVPYRETCGERSGCLSSGAEIRFPRVYRVINHITDQFGGKK